MSSHKKLENLSTLHKYMRSEHPPRSTNTIQQSEAPYCIPHKKYGYASMFVILALHNIISIIKNHIMAELHLKHSGLCVSNNKNYKSYMFHHSRFAARSPTITIHSLPHSLFALTSQAKSPKS